MMCKNGRWCVENIMNNKEYMCNCILNVYIHSLEQNSLSLMFKIDIVYLNSWPIKKESQSIFYFYKIQIYSNIDCYRFIVAKLLFCYACSSHIQLKKSAENLVAIWIKQNKTFIFKKNIYILMKCLEIK